MKYLIGLVGENGGAAAAAQQIFKKENNGSLDEFRQKVEELYRIFKDRLR